MRVWNYLSAQTSRRALMVLGLVAMMGTSVAHAQTPAAAAPAAPDVMKIDADAGTTAAIVYTVKPDKTADFEAIWTQIKGLYATVDDPGLKSVGASISRVLKLPTPQGVAYWFFIDAVVKDQSYDWVKIVYFVKPSLDPSVPGVPLLKRDEEANPLWDKLKACIVGINPPIKFTKVG